MKQISNVSSSQFQSIETELRFRKLEEKKKAKGKLEETKLEEQENAEEDDLTDLTLADYHYGLDHRKFMEKHHNKYLFATSQPTVPIVSNFHRRYSFSHHIQHKFAYIWFNEHCSRAVLLTHISNINDIHKEARNIQNDVNKRAKKRYVDNDEVPKYKTQSRRLLPHTLFAITNVENVENVKIPYVDQVLMSQRFEEIVEIYADGKHNVLRVLKIFDYLEGMTKERKVKSAFIDNGLFIDPPNPNRIGYWDSSSIDLLKDVPFVQFSVEEIYNNIRKVFAEYPELDGDEGIISKLIERFSPQQNTQQNTQQNVQTMGTINSPKFMEERISTLKQFLSEVIGK